MLGAEEPISERISSMLAVPVRSRNSISRSERELRVDMDEPDFPDEICSHTLYSTKPDLSD
jgi:hypothetical protein